MAELAKAKVEYVLDVEPEDMPITGNAIASGDSAYDRQVEAELIQKRDSGDVWAWCTVTVKARFHDFEGWSTLGCVSCVDEADFRKNHYWQMCQEALNNLLDNLAEAQAIGEKASLVREALHELPGRQYH